MWSNIGAKIIFSFSVMLALLLVVAGVAAYSLTVQSRAADKILEEWHEMVGIAEIAMNIERAATAVSDYLDKGHADERERFRTLVNGMKAGFETLERSREEVADARYRAHEEKEEAVALGLRDDIAEFERQGKAALALPAAELAERREAVKAGLYQVAGRINERIAAFQQEDRHTASVTLSNLHRARHRAKRALLWGVAASMLAGLVLGTLAYTSIVGPLTVLHRAARHVGEGDFSHRAQVPGRGQIADLAREFNTMAARLQELYGKLEQKVQERTQQLEHSARLAGIGTLAAGVAHEINNPLATIAGCAEGLLDRLRALPVPLSEALEDFPEYLKTISDEAFRCKAITEKLLDFARQREPSHERVDIHALLRDTGALMEHHDSLRNSRILFTFADQPLFVLGDVNQLRQVLFNLFVNALDAVSKGGEVRVRTKLLNGLVTITFQDDGCGIPAENLGKIFDPFFTTKPPGRGTGLGLSVCHSIVTRHGGTISTASEGLGKGATFTLSFPPAPIAKET